MTEYIKLREANCKNCHKCIRHCPVKAIGFSQNQARIVADECILCGECFVTCPQNAKRVRDDIPRAKELVQSGADIVASVAPSYAAAFPGVAFADLSAALARLGFCAAEETAVGATIVKKRYEQLLREAPGRVIISSCCHTVNLLVQKYYPGAQQYLAKVVSPMIAHGMSIKSSRPQSRVVFIGPCISKMAEAEQNPGIVDCVLTFEELALWLEQERIALPQTPRTAAADGRARLFPTAGGIIDCMDKEGLEHYSFIAVDGIENCVAALEDISDGRPEGCFIEMSACAGSCVGGPARGKTAHSPLRDRLAARATAGREDFAVAAADIKAIELKLPLAPLRRVKPGSRAVDEVLKKMGKTLPEHELNCGSCGYETCRRKAEAVLAGKAEITMCMPFLMARAESFSDNIIGNSPNGIIVLNRAMEIQQINAAALHLMNISDETAVLGRNVICILDPAPFAQAVSDGENLFDKRVFLAEYGKYIKLTVVADANYNIVIGFMRDITDEHTAHLGKEEHGRKAIEIADRVIEKQMRTVQEIASLLGETTAETKVALERLKETLRE